ncbi:MULTISPECIES: rhomboid family intramembrane serine protease [Rummeliibacillus]|uniref:Rhomboid family intramembrane serine protease n=1 Tax=Rummeliibacillus stabekisii TaxID=241244 RepID=A0A143HEL6_9BACL|nr:MULTISPECIES: rhomboid family intramembrane serine protease [Rummeliibacillus]AMX00173.1 rhomboid family intramembrane serine protease [Rummeliibacillus stabekisii]MBB5171522.1 rhomboid protease GluP [Rummeliibacillus stabekisii]GEL05830.1 putative rhomboid protease YdcA [Rummeliibacillus stabekisii]
MFNRTEKLSQYILLYPVISIIIGINIAVYLIGLIPPLGLNIVIKGAAANYLIADGEYWRLLTSMFIHGGFFHLLFNMFSLYVFGPELERLAGKLRFFTIYFVSGFMGNVVSYLIQPANYVSYGASGAVFGLFGAFLALVYYTRKTMPQLKQIIMPIVVISVIMTFLQPNVNATAHIAGLVTGLIIGLFDFHPKRVLRWIKKN